MHHTTTKGDIGVAMVTADLLCQGYEVMMPVSAVSPFDVVAYRCGNTRQTHLYSSKTIGSRQDSKSLQLWFESTGLCQTIWVYCQLVDGELWKLEAGGSSPPIQTIII